MHLNPETTAAQPASAVALVLVISDLPHNPWRALRRNPDLSLRHLGPDIDERPSQESVPAEKIRRFRPSVNCHSCSTKALNHVTTMAFRRLSRYVSGTRRERPETLVGALASRRCIDRAVDYGLQGATERPTYIPWRRTMSSLPSRLPSGTFRWPFGLSPIPHCPFRTCRLGGEPLVLG